MLASMGTSCGCTQATATKSPTGSHLIGKSMPTSPTTPNDSAKPSETTPREATEYRHQDIYHDVPLTWDELKLAMRALQTHRGHLVTLSWEYDKNNKPHDAILVREKVKDVDNLLSKLEIRL